MRKGSIMATILILLQVFVALGIYNVWIIRARKATAFRGGDAKTISEEFKNYGLPSVFVPIVGGLKLLAATCLIAGIWFPELVKPSAGLIAFLMLGAVAMHIKVKDPIFKALPAAGMLVLNILIIAGHL
jgi:hypothetical protein